MRYFLTLIAGSALVGAVLAQEGPSGKQKSTGLPMPVPLTRPEMKQFLEDLKGRTPRIPLPERTEAEKEKLGERGNGYEARLRYHYMPAGADGRGGFGFGKGADPKMSLGYEFKTRLFWIVSRTNNCQY